MATQASGANAREKWLAVRRDGWTSRAARIVSGWLAFLVLTGVGIEVLPFWVVNQHALLLHTLLGLLCLPFFVYFLVQHVRAWWDFPLTHVKLTGWASGAMALACIVSGVVLAGEGALGRATTYSWRLVHEVTTWGLLAFLVPHLWAIVYRELGARAQEDAGSAVLPALRQHARIAGLFLGVSLASLALLTLSVRPVDFANEFPAGYEMQPYAGAGPFAPSLATTTSGGAFDARSLSGSASCGTTGCHEQIYEEWLPSAHRYAALDFVFQAIQGTMAQQNGETSTRYCAGCHDPISLFSGTKYIGVEHLTDLAGFQEGVSCLVCHAMEETDVKGNANFVLAQPERYVWELRQGAVAGFLSEFLIRTYPEHHVQSLSRRMFKTPEFCAACHKQFIDEQVNQVGWVQLQNQYDNWKGSRWNQPGEPNKTLECRECHMPLSDSSDPAAGDVADFNRTAKDGKHRGHRFLGANQFIPVHQELEGGALQADLVARWLRGEIDVPEIRDRWREGPAVPLSLDVPESARPGETIPLRVHMINNKVGHDFPTGPLDIIQAWVEIVVKDDTGRVLFHTGQRDEQNFIEPGTFMFKAEPVDRYGNLIDHHNLWEMVGVRFKRSLFPGAIDVASFDFLCPGSDPGQMTGMPPEQNFQLQVPTQGASSLDIEARLNYRKVDQYLISFAMGKSEGLTAPVTVVSHASARISIVPGSGKSLGPDAESPGESSTPASPAPAKRGGEQ